METLTKYQVERRLRADRLLTYMQDKHRRDFTKAWEDLKKAVIATFVKDEK